MKEFYSFCLVLRFLKFGAVLRKNPLSAQCTPVPHWAMQSQSLTQCKLMYMHWKQLIYKHCEPSVSKSLAELQWRKVCLSNCKKGVSTRVCLTTKCSFQILRGINMLQTYCQKTPFPTTIITGELNKLQSLFFPNFLLNPKCSLN